MNHVRVTCSCSSRYLKIYNNAIIWGSAQCAHIVSLSLSGTGLCSSVNPFCKSETLHQFRLTCMVQKQPEPVSTNSVSSWSGWLDPRWTLGSCLYGDRCTVLLPLYITNCALISYHSKHLFAHSACANFGSNAHGLDYSIILLTIGKGMCISVFCS